MNAKQLTLVNVESIKKPDPLAPVIEKMVNDLHTALISYGYVRRGDYITDDNRQITIDDVKEVLAEALSQAIDFSDGIDENSSHFFFFECLKEVTTNNHLIYQPYEEQWR